MPIVITLLNLIGQKIANYPKNRYEVFPQVVACIDMLTKRNVFALFSNIKAPSLIQIVRTFQDNKTKQFISVLPRIMKHQFTICVEGNIASGKTRFIEYFKKYSDIVEAFAEPTKEWRNLNGQNVLAKMYEDPHRWGAMFQSYNQLTMSEIHTKAQSTPVKLMERSLYSGRYCFIENLHRSKVMTDMEYTVLCKWFNYLTKDDGCKVDLIVYLQTQPEVLHERIKARQRPEEQTIPLKYLEDLHQLHEDWLVNKTLHSPPAPVLIFDANQDLQTMYKLFEEQKSKILFGLPTS